MNKNYPILAREGWPFVALTVLLFLISIYFINSIAIIFTGIICLFVIQFFRDPQRKIVAKSNEVVTKIQTKIDISIFGHSFLTIV